MTPGELTELRRHDLQKNEEREKAMTLLDASSLAHLLRSKGDKGLKEEIA